ncbi:MAG: YceI family protein [Bacteroidetes bacterium]|nr:YceI family protein [Bacteroidota bacterium]
MKKTMIVAAILLAAGYVHAQDKFYTKTGKITFDATSASSPEKVAGVNRSVTCVLDTKNGNMQFAVLMKGFEFEKALMQEHFNENYVESNKFPKAEFKGAITNNTSVNYTKDGVYNVKVKGQLTIHGITKDVETEGKITIKGGKPTAIASFPAALADYNIGIPSIVADKVAKIATVTVECMLDPLK